MTARPDAGSPRVLVVGAGPFQLDIIRSARQLGAAVIAVDRNADAPGMSLAHESVAIDTTDVAAVVALAEARRVDGVVTAASDVALEAVAAVVEARGLVGPKVDVVRVCADKLATFAAMRSAGLPVPETIPATNVAEALEAARSFGGQQLVMKPRSSAGGRGVSILDNDTGPGGRAALTAAFELALQYAKTGEGALVQEYIDGTSVGVEAFFSAGRLVRAFVLNDQFRDGFVSPVGHSLPSSLRRPLLDEVIESVARFASAAGFTDGPANFDLRQRNSETVLIEINPRLGGNSITGLVRAATGADLSLATVQLALGRPVDALTTDDGAAGSSTRASAASRLLLLRGRGRLRFDADALERWIRRNTPDGGWVTVLAKSGAPAQLAVDSWSLVGSCLARADAVGEAEARASEIATSVEGRFGMEP